MIIDHNKVTDIITTFLANEIKTSKASNFMIRYDGTISGILTILLCEKARAKCGADIFIICERPLLMDAFEFAKLIIPPEDCYFEWFVNFSEIEQCLIISSLNRLSGIVERNFSKHLSVSDMYPILDLYHSEVLDLVSFLKDDKLFNSCVNREYLNHELLEWADRENIKNGIISDDIQPTSNHQWFKYTKPQKEIIAKLHQREKSTRHKNLESSGKPIVLLHGIQEIIR